MIPKTIHFCWFSDEPYPEKIQRCIESWHQFLPDYHVKKWDTTNFYVNINPYVQEAFECHKWAFASDYVRLYALYTEGGIYLDSDIECLKSMDDLLCNKAFTGFEAKGMVAAWIFGSEKGNPIFKEFLDYYEGRHFLVDGEMDLTPNPVPVSAICRQHGMTAADEIQRLDDITIYPKRFFCGKDVSTGIINVTPDTYTIHHFTGAWVPPV